MDSIFTSTFLSSFLRGDYMPHGHCFLWQPGILWVTVLSDFLIGVSYFVISGTLIFFIRKRKDLEFRAIFILFGSFILWCGLTHLFAIHTMWHGAYGWMAIIKLVTATVSALTAVVLIQNFKNLLQIPNPQQLESALQQAARRDLERSQLEAQRKAESIFKFAIELLPTGLLVINSNKEIVVANEALEKMFGYERNELIGKSISTLLKSSQTDHHNILVEQYLANPSQDHAMASGRVVRGKNKLGEDVAIEISLSVYELEGSPHAFASVIDVNRVTKEQKLLVEDSNRLSRAISAANDGIWEWNVQTNDVWYSPTLMRMIGCDADSDKAELKLWEDHIHPDDLAQVKLALDNHFFHGGKYNVIYRGIAESGNYEWMHTRGDTLFDMQNTPLLMSGTLSNISEKKLLEENLAEKTHFLNVVLEKSLCGIYIFDLKERKIVYVNEQYTAITGYTLRDLDDLPPDGLFSLFHPDDQPRIEDHIVEVVNSKKDQSQIIDYRFLQKDGRWIWCYSRDSIYSLDKASSSAQIIGTFFDITEIKIAEKSLALSNASLERFAYSASHDMQEPLRKITAFSSSLAKRLSGKLDEPEALYELDRISNAATRMREMIDSLLQLSRYSRQTLKKQPIQLSELVKMVKDNLSELISESNAEIYLKNNIEILVDIPSFQQVLQNLITNSIRYAKQDVPAIIDVDCQRERNICAITIMDQGCGFPMDSADKIFEPFKRLTGRTVPGSGMGLAICKQIVLAHDGTISASGTVDNGATFLIRIPK